MTRAQMLVLVAGMVTGTLLALSAGMLTRSDILTPVLAIGLTAPLGWASMDLFGRLRSRRRRGVEFTGDDDTP